MNLARTDCIAESAIAAEQHHGARPIVDLSMGAWSPSFAARDIATQVGLELPVAVVGDSVNLINLGVDSEARGDGTLLSQYHHARALAPLLRDAGGVAVLRPRFGLPLRQDNRALLRYLHGLGVPIEWMNSRSADRPALPDLLRIYPGLVDEGMLAMLSVSPDHPALSCAGEDRWLVDPAARTLDPRQLPLLVDRLAAFEAHNEALFAYCQMLGSPLFIDAERLSAFAMTMVHSSRDLALDLALKARAGARTGVEIGLSELRLQGMRIFLHRFDEVAATPPPSNRVPAGLRAELFTLRGWGQVMTGNVAEAEYCFGEGAGAESRNGALYARNIAALARFRTGDIAGARLIEEEIAADLARTPDPDAQLQFVNALNLGRLGRAAGDDNFYRAMLKRAAQTSDNVRSAAEILQLNMLEGFALAETEPDKAAFCWLRGAFAWLALEPPEALAKRAMRAVLGSDVVAPRAIDGEVSRAIDGLLARSWPNVVPHASPRSAHVLLSDDAQHMPVHKVVGRPGIALCWSSTRDRRLPRVAETMRLAARAFTIVQSEVGPMPPPDIGSWVIDAATGCDIRASQVDACASRWRHGLALASAETATLSVTLGPAIRQVESRGATRIVRFKRHLAPAEVRGEAAALLDRVMAEHRIVISTLPAAVGQTVRAMVEQRLLGIRAFAA